MSTPPASAGQTIYLVFKTHLDIGFTDHAAKVREQYHQRFIPQAIDTGEHFFCEDPERPAFVWTTGAWLIWDHLNSQPRASVQRLELAIERGLIRWHALPFTTHSELMSPALFRAGLSYSAELDERFGKKTIAAKMTDVPGHTRGIVPLLAEAGVKFLHIGVNAASPAPDVPDLFRWRAPGGEEIVVMYEKSYGATQFPQGFETGLSFAHTSDNIGPQSVSQTVDVYRDLKRQYPGATIKATTLESYGALLWRRRQEFPVIDLELGDNWIHGGASDPVKLQRFLALQRLYDGFADAGLSPRRLAFGRGLAMVAEHTWGVDIKSFLRDESAWDRPAFEAARKADFRFVFTEASWAEQRAFLEAAVSELNADDRKLAQQAVKACRPPKPAKPQFGAKPARNPLQIGGWAIAFDAASGDLTAITSPAGHHLSGRNKSLLGYRYESYDTDDMARHLDSYLTQRIEWALLDHDKPGLGRAATARSMRWMPALTDLTQRDETAVLGLELPPTASAELGGPKRIELWLQALPDGLQINLVLRDKPANRMPEAAFLTLTPETAGPWDYHKMGLWQPGGRVAGNGGGQLQAVAAVRSRLPGGQMLFVATLDTPLVAPADTDFMSFSKTPPNLSAGLRFNLHNNKWGTNFPMWWEGDLLARFVLRIGPSESER